MKAKNDYYKCYSKPLKIYLEREGFYIVEEGMHPFTNKPYWCFKMTNLLSIALKQWTINKPTNK